MFAGRSSRERDEIITRALVEEKEPSYLFSHLDEEHDEIYVVEEEKELSYFAWLVSGLNCNTYKTATRYLFSLVVGSRCLPANVRRLLLWIFLR